MTAKTIDIIIKVVSVILDILTFKKKRKGGKI